MKLSALGSGARETMIGFLSHNWAGLVIAGAVGLLGVAAIWIGRLVPSGFNYLAFACGVALLLAALVLMAAAVRHLVLVSAYRQRYPAPGRLIDIGGLRIHVMAEGAGSPTVVWIPGSHSQGLSLNHLHLATSKFTRSVLFDRPSSGWSDVGAFPKVVREEAAQLEAALRLAGESPPYVIAAHSFGGALAVTFADLYPGLVAGLVLLDSSTPDAVFSLSIEGGRKVPGLGMKGVLKTAFGGGWSRMKKMGPAERHLFRDLLDVGEAMLANDAQPKSPAGFTSALERFWREPLGVPRGSLALGEVPIFAVIPPEQPFTSEQLQKLAPSLPAYCARNFLRTCLDAQHSVARLSSRGELRLAPAGATHSFPYESPDFVMKQVREMVDLAREGAGK